MLGISEPGALNYYTFFRLIPLTLFISRNLTSIFLPLSGFSALQSHGTHSRSGIFSTDVANASGGVIIFVKQCLSFSELSTSSLSLLGPYSDYVEVNISLNDSSSLSFLNVYVPLFVLLQKIVEPISFLSPFFPPMWKRKRWNFRASASTGKVPLPLPHPCERVDFFSAIGDRTNANCATKFFVPKDPDFSFRFFLEKIISPSWSQVPPIKNHCSHHYITASVTFDATMRS